MTDCRRTGRLLVTAAFVTALGNNVQLIAGALLLVRDQHTMAAVGWLFVAVALPQAALSPVFGRLADRRDRRALWIGCDAASAAVALGLPVWLAAGGAPAPGVYGANFALALLGALFVPVSAALVKERIAAGEGLRRFNGSYEIATQAGMLLSATVGGLGVQAFGAVPLLVFNAATFAVSALCVAATGGGSGAATRVGGPVRRAGARVLAGGTVPAGGAVSAGGAVPAGGPNGGAPGNRGAGSGRPGDPAPQAGASARAPGPRPRLGRLILLYAQGTVVVTVFNALMPTYVLGQLHLGAGTFGAVDALGSLGFVAAAAVYRVVGGRLGDRRIALGGFAACSVALGVQGAFGLAGLVILVPFGAFVFGQARIATRNLLMATAGHAEVGRVFGLANGGALAATVLVMPGMSYATDHTSATWGFALLGALAAANLAVAAMPVPRRRRSGAEPVAAPTPAPAPAAR